MLRRIAIIAFILVLIFFLWVVAGNRAMQKNLLHDQQTLAALSEQPVSMRNPDTIPEPIRRYLSWAVMDSIRPIRMASLAHGAYYGVIHKESDRYKTRWKYIVAERWVVPHRKAFTWRGLMHIKHDFWSKCRYHFIGDNVFRVWKWMGILKHSHAFEGTISQNALLEHLAGSMWIPTQLISDPHLEMIALDDTTVQLTYLSLHDTVQANLIFDLDGKPKWFLTEDYLFETENGLQKTSWHVKYQGYSEMLNYRMPSRMSAIIQLNNSWVDQYDFRLDEWAFQYETEPLQDSWIRQ